MFDLTNETFSLGQSILDSYAYNPPYDLTGYKQKGKLRTDNGKMDCMELYSINQDDILGNCQRRRNVGSIEANRLQIRNFIQQSRTVSEVILAQLDGQLGLQPGTLAALSPLDQPSDSSVRLLLAQPQLNPQTDSITLGGHTDIGTITLLFNVIGGLQILPARSENVMANWRYVKPEVGCAIVNIGDTIVEWTGGLLRSSLHRVVTAPGKQALVPRRSVAYLARAQKNASMRRLRSGLISPLEKDHEETCTVTEWAAWRSQQIIRGELKPQTRGGKTRDECESSPQI
ncbi:oxidoreductase 2OG-Fe(II) oxygenase family [Penicillium macrosclerotiorum]|uniref:oxidoreductase 2OG-Fe(II) oxygenase family n=1 Tax=Penicillium macrosclerotiorum TaxID=303699 RepID=UPI0025485D7E|nr:oxidoreductase 2OG-Fe(II) oxygenase family [Penicillium macrosclerotiorum]KAJ5699023.1 oxidoreductase 2OG-Fe(II) oxygenase family [Penicillium macrosclerotiorum]